MHYLLEKKIAKDGSISHEIWLCLDSVAAHIAEKTGQPKIKVLSFLKRISIRIKLNWEDTGYSFISDPSTRVACALYQRKYNRVTYGGRTSKLRTVESLL